MQVGTGPSPSSSRLKARMVEDEIRQPMRTMERKKGCATRTMVSFLKVNIHKKQMRTVEALVPNRT